MATTHIDALCHVFVDGQMYNGFPATEVKSTGARRGSIMCASDGIGRAACCSTSRARAASSGSSRATRSLVARARRGRTSARRAGRAEGDILLVATGRDARRAEHGPWVPIARGLAGLHPECVRVAARARHRGARLRRRLRRVARHPIDGWAMPIHQCALVGDGRAPARQPAARPVGATRAREQSLGSSCSPLRRCGWSGATRVAGQSDRGALSR